MWQGTESRALSGTRARGQTEAGAPLSARSDSRGETDNDTRPRHPTEIDTAVKSHCRESSGASATDTSHRIPNQPKPRETLGSTESRRIGGCRPSVNCEIGEGLMIDEKKKPPLVKAAREFIVGIQLVRQRIGNKGIALLVHALLSHAKGICAGAEEVTCSPSEQQLADLMASTSLLRPQHRYPLRARAMRG